MALAVLGYGLYSYIKCRRMVRQAVLLLDNIWECDRIPSPFVFGIFRPRIYIPFHLNEEERTYILQHEQFHIRRKDPIIKLGAYLLLAVYWFNPLVWLAYYLMVEDMEMSCDEAVLRKMARI